MPIIVCISIILATIIGAINNKNPYEQYFGHTVTITGIITNDPVYKKDDWRIILQSEFGKIYVMLPKSDGLKRSDELQLRGQLQNGFGDYAAFLYEPTIEKISHPSVQDYALSIRDWFANNLQNKINNAKESALALSYLTGQKALLDEEMQNKLRLVGLAHVVVASGYHLSIVVNLAKRRFARISRFATFGGATIMLIIYISITGFSPSMTRAGMVTFLSLAAWYFGRCFHPLRLLIYVAAISLLIEPSYISNLAWQLSFASYAGIMFLSPVLTKFFYGDKKPNYFANLIIASISAQLFCLPITIYSFGSLSGLALVANVLVTPTIPIVMLLSFFAGITCFAPVAFVVSKLLSLHLAIVDAIANISWASLELPAGRPQIFLIYIPVLLLLLWLKWRTKYSYRPSYALEKSPDYDKI